MSHDFKGRLFRRGEPGYEDARGAAVWRANKPDRFPEAIVVAESDMDVQAAVRLAEAENLKIGVRSGGHSWVSPHIRDGSLLIDLSRLQRLDIDVESRSAWVDAGVKGRRVNDELTAHDLMVPTGHHNTVGCGGFLMCGGFGWNFRQWGTGSANVTAIELVTAEGELIQADATQNQDYFWAARGGGSGYFGVVLRFRVNAYPRPAFLRSNGYVFPLEVMEEALTWFFDMCRKAPQYVELVGTGLAADPQGNPVSPRLSVSGLTFAQTEEEALAVKALFDTCPVKDRAISRRDNEPTTLELRYEGATAVDPEGFRYAVDNRYTDAEAADIVPLMRELIETMPTHRTHVFVLHQGARPNMDGMALSAWGENYVAAYPIWEDPSQDEDMERWVVDQMARFDGVANGEGQMNDENMRVRHVAYLSPENAAKLEMLRDRYDPEKRFVSFLR